MARPVLSLLVRTTNEAVRTIDFVVNAAEAGVADPLFPALFDRISAVKAIEENSVLFHEATSSFRFEVNYSYIYSAKH